MPYFSIQEEIQLISKANDAFHHALKLSGHSYLNVNSEIKSFYALYSISLSVEI